jgi:hypothetical protein
MGKLGELLRQLFVNGLEGAGGAFGLDVSYRIFIIGLIVASFSVAYASVAGLISAFNFVVNDELSRAMSWFVPVESITCIAALISAKIARAVLDYHLLIIMAGGQLNSPVSGTGRIGGPTLPSP